MTADRSGSVRIGPEELRKSLKLTLLTVILLLALISALSWLALDLYRFGRTSAGMEERPVLFEIAPGERFKQVTERLYQSGIISDARRFKILAYIKKADTQFKAGEYRLTAAMTPLEVIHHLVHGRIVIRSLTIPEGYSLVQIAAEFERAGLTDTAHFIDLATRPETPKAFDLEAQTLEGYLFPDTYYFSRNDSAETVIARMVQRFKEQLPPGWRERAAELGLSLHQLVTLASIIEKETGAPAERPLVASVFHNRLKNNMRMDSDPTVIYGLPEFDGNLTRRHLTTPTPYNTYVIKGLPPGPIANPGREAIEAALYPAQTDFLFFVARKDRTHQFSTNLQDHNQAVREHQMRPKKRTAP
jgi:UPF0755 protein